MRKLLVAALALAAVMAVAGVAFAANTYVVDLAKAGKGKGSMKKPIPTKLDFGYKVGDDADQRPFVIKQYRIAAEGTRAYPKSRPKCTYDQATNPNVTDPDKLTACKKANVGSGIINNLAGAPNDRSQKLPCDVKLTLFNISTGDRERYRSTHKQIKKRGGIAIRIDTDPPDCPIPVHEALAAPFYDTKIEGIPTTELRFTVPDSLRHPGGLDNSVVNVVSHIKKLTGRVPVRRGTPVAAAKRRVGFYSLVGRKGKTRTTRVTFVDESGAKKTALKKSK